MTDIPNKSICSTCGHALQPGQAECPNCGAIVDQPQIKAIQPSPIDSKPIELNPGEESKKKKTSPAAKRAQSPIRTIQSRLEKAHAYEQNGESAKALDIYKQALAEAQKALDKSPLLQPTVQMLEVLIQRLEQIRALPVVPVTFATPPDLEDVTPPEKGTETAGETKPERKIPAWLAVQELLKTAQSNEQAGQFSEALSLYYQALVLAANQRRENPTMSLVIHNLLSLIEGSERAFLTDSASGSLKSDQKKQPREKQIIPTEAAAISVASEKQFSKSVIGPENIGALGLKDTWNELGSGEGDLYQVAFSPSGALLALAIGSEVQLLRAGTGDMVTTLLGHSDQVYSVAFSPDEKSAASGSEDWDIYLWTVKDGAARQKLEGHKEGVTSVAFSPDGHLLASASLDNTVRLWSLKDGHPIRILTRHKNGVESIVYSTDGRYLASADDDGLICLWDGKGQSLARAWHAHRAAIASLAFSANGQLLASSSDDGVVQLWNPSDGRIIIPLKGQKNSVESLAFAANDLLLASGGGDGTVCIWRVSDGMLVSELEHDGSVLSVSFSPDGRSLVTALESGKVCLWKLMSD